MSELTRADDDGGADRLPNTFEQTGAARRNLVVAGVLIASGALLRFAMLLYLDSLLAAVGVGDHPAFPSMAWSVRELAHILADSTETGILLCGVLLAVWYFWSVRGRPHKPPMSSGRF